MPRKPSFLERLTGAVRIDDYDDEFDDDMRGGGSEEYEEETERWQQPQEEEEQEGSLPVDMYQTNDSIVIKALIAGVKPEDLDVAITRDMVTIRGRRESGNDTNRSDDYFHQELYWGSFARTIVLPQEIAIDECEAKERHGLLTITMPKLDKARQTKLKVRSQ